MSFPEIPHSLSPLYNFFCDIPLCLELKALHFSYLLQSSYVSLIRAGCTSLLVHHRPEWLQNPNFRLWGEAIGVVLF